ncbi:MAG: MFS transporter [Clostridia bacterium]|nr:MFS transporter [Clostridia bacterium]
MIDNELIQCGEKHSYDGAAIKLILLTMITYLVSYIGRKSWSSNINETMAFFGVNKGTIGIVDTCFFITYALGQVVHGLLCKYYNPKWIIFSALIASSIVNFVIAILPSNMFWIVPIVWSINGFAMASLWPLMIRVFNINLAKKHLKTSLFAMSFPVSLGYLCAYALSAIFSAVGHFHLSFYTASILLIANAIIWLFWVDSLIGKCKTERNEVDGEDVVEKKEEQIEKHEEKKKSAGKSFWMLFGILALFAIVDNLLKDGIMSWTPTILKETYNLENWKSVLLTIIIPLFAVLGGIISLKISSKIKNYILLCGVFFAGVSVVLLGLIFSFKLPSWILPLMCLVITYALMSAINNVVTNIYPLQVDKNVNAGMIAGLIDGFCYVGSAISSFGIGSIVDRTGNWNIIFYIFAICAVLCTVTSYIIYFFSNKKKKA